MWAGPHLRLQALSALIRRPTTCRGPSAPGCPNLETPSASTRPSPISAALRFLGPGPVGAKQTKGSFSFFSQKIRREGGRRILYGLGRGMGRARGFSREKWRSREEKCSGKWGSRGCLERGQTGRKIYFGISSFVPYCPLATHASRLRFAFRADREMAVSPGKSAESAVCWRRDDGRALRGPTAPRLRDSVAMASGGAIGGRGQGTQGTCTVLARRRFVSAVHPIGAESSRGNETGRPPWDGRNASRKSAGRAGAGIGSRLGHE